MWASSPEGGVWRYAALDLFALAYFFQKWNARVPQHRQFHFVMMLSYLASTAYYAFRSLIEGLQIDAFGMSDWWHTLISNLLFELELLFIVVYALLYRRARTDNRKFRADVEAWFGKAARAKREIFRRR